MDKLDKAAEEMDRILKPNGKFMIITANPETYNIRKTFYKSYKIENNLLIGDFDLGDGEILTETTLYLHTLEAMKKAITSSGLVIDNTDRLGKGKDAPNGLYILFSGHKDSS